MIINTKSVARKLGVDFSLVPSDLVLDQKCPCCGCDFVFAPGKKGPVPSSPTLDRFDPSRGFIAGNVNIICFSCHTIKSGATIEKIEMVAKWMRLQQSQ